MLKKLIKLANSLDTRGFHVEADLIDEILKVAVENWQYYGFNSPEDYEEHKETRTIPEAKTEVAPKEPVEQEQQSWRPDEKFKWQVVPGWMGSTKAVGGFVSHITDEIYRFGGKVVEVAGQDNIATILYEMPDVNTAENFAADYSSEITINSIGLGSVTVTIGQVNGFPNEIAIDFEAAAVKPNQTPEKLYAAVRDTISSSSG